MDSFLIAFNAVMPFLLYISFGYFVKSIKLVDEAFLNKLNHMVFKAFFPLLMFNNLYQVEAGFRPDVTVVIFGFVSLITVIALAWLIVPRIIKENPKRGVIIQAIYRSNFVLFAIPLTANIFGDESIALASMMVAIIVPTYNVVAVILLEYYNGGKAKTSALIKSICTNPLVMGAVVGFIFTLTGIRLPSFLEKSVTQFANMSTPLALFVLGGTLHFSAIRGNAKYLVPTLLTKMVFIPAIVLTIAVALGFEPIERFLVFTMYATPVATASYTMAKNMGGDGELAGELVIISTAASVISIFLWVFFMKQFGII